MSAEKQKSKNPIKKLYDNGLNAAVGKWICSIVILGLSAAAVAKVKEGPVRPAAIVNLAFATFHFFLLGPPVDPISATNPRTPKWYIVVLGISTAMWTVGPVLMFAMLYGNDKEGVSYLERRRLGGLVGEITSIARSGTESICIAAGCFGLSALILSLYQWYFVIAVHTKQFTAEQIKEGYDELVTNAKKK